MADVLRIGVGGLGTVGGGLLRLIETHGERIKTATGKDIAVTAVCARDRNKDRGVDLSRAQWFDDAVALANSDDIDVYVELIGGDEGVALDSVHAALQTGKHVVTANKALLATHGVDLARLAEDNNVALAFEAAVAGGIPIIKTLREALVGNAVSRVYGILNGTCNYILTKMIEEGLDYDAVLKEAQEVGFAETDPSLDVEGIDAKYKLVIVMFHAFGLLSNPENVFNYGITRISPFDIKFAKNQGYNIKLIAKCKRIGDHIEAYVMPSFVADHSTLSFTKNEYNAVILESAFSENQLLYGIKWQKCHSKENTNG